MKFHERNKLCCSAECEKWLSSLPDATKACALVTACRSLMKHKNRRMTSANLHIMPTNNALSCGADKPAVLTLTSNTIDCRRSITICRFLKICQRTSGPETVLRLHQWCIYAACPQYCNACQTALRQPCKSPVYETLEPLKLNWERASKPGGSVGFYAAVAEHIAQQVRQLRLRRVAAGIARALYRAWQ